MPIVKKILNQYVGDGKGWVDPFAGNNSPAEFTNDLNPETKAIRHLHAVDFCKMLNGVYDGILFDPPYSIRQAKECYEGFGETLFKEDAMRFPSNVKREIYKKIKVGGYAISFGWNSSGFGKRMGFEVIEVYLINHKRRSNDTIVTIERKITKGIFDLMKEDKV